MFKDMFTVVVLICPERIDCLGPFKDRETIADWAASCGHTLDKTGESGLTSDGHHFQVNALLSY